MPPENQVASKHLHPHQRVTLVKRGLSDSSEAVVDACRFMVCAHWFRDVGYDPVELLQRLDVVGVDVSVYLRASRGTQTSSVRILTHVRETAVVPTRKRFRRYCAGHAPTTVVQNVFGSTGR